MPRPRLFSTDEFLDAAADLVIEDGREALTVRRLSERTGASNGSIYHAFGSIESLLGRSWLRSARQFLDLQRDAVTAAAPDGRRAVLAAADAPAVFAGRDARAARFLASLRRDGLLVPGLDPATAEELRALDRDLVRLLRDLARLTWGRADAAAVDAVRVCVVTLPGAMLLPGIRAGRFDRLPLARRRLAAAAGAVLDLGVPGGRR